jgi:hypothetical protein
VRLQTPPNTNIITTYTCNILIYWAWSEGRQQQQHISKCEFTLSKFIATVAATTKNIKQKFSTVDKTVPTSTRHDDDGAIVCGL